MAANDNDSLDFFCGDFSVFFDDLDTEETGSPTSTFVDQSKEPNRDKEKRKKEWREQKKAGMRPADVHHNKVSRKLLSHMFETNDTAPVPFAPASAQGGPSGAGSSADAVSIAQGSLNPTSSLPSSPHQGMESLLGPGSSDVGSTNGMQAVGSLCQVANTQLGTSLDKGLSGASSLAVGGFFGSLTPNNSTGIAGGNNQVSVFGGSMGSSAAHGGGKLRKKGQIGRKNSDAKILNAAWFDLSKHVVTSPEWAQEMYAPEDEDGNFEYKRMLCTCTPQRLQQLTTQMQYRLREGHGVCRYFIGVDDDGYPRGITDEEMQDSIRNLYACADVIDPSISRSATRICIKGSRLVIADLRFEMPVKEEKKISAPRIRSRLIICGSSAAGKSSLVGCLVKNLKSDNGSGLARSLVLQFPHEVLSGGVTSSHTKHIYNRDLELVDVPGDSRYLKTALRAILGMNNFTPLLLVHDIRNNFPSAEFRTYVKLAKILNRQLMVLLTKCDLIDAGATAKETLENDDFGGLAGLMGGDDDEEAIAQEEKKRARDERKNSDEKRAHFDSASRIQKKAEKAENKGRKGDAKKGDSRHNSEHGPPLSDASQKTAQATNDEAEYKKGELWTKNSPIPCSPQSVSEMAGILESLSVEDPPIVLLSADQVPDNSLSELCDVTGLFGGQYGEHEDVFSGLKRPSKKDRIICRDWMPSTKFDLIGETSSCLGDKRDFTLNNGDLNATSSATEPVTGHPLQEQVDPDSPKTAAVKKDLTNALTNFKSLADMTRGNLDKDTWSRLKRLRGKTYLLQHKIAMSNGHNLEHLFGVIGKLRTLPDPDSRRQRKKNRRLRLQMQEELLENLEDLCEVDRTKPFDEAESSPSEKATKKKLAAELQQEMEIAAALDRENSGYRDDGDDESDDDSENDGLFESISSLGKTHPLCSETDGEHTVGGQVEHTAGEQVLREVAPQSPLVESLGESMTDKLVSDTSKDEANHEIGVGGKRRASSRREARKDPTTHAHLLSFDDMKDESDSEDDKILKALEKKQAAEALLFASKSCAEMSSKDTANSGPGTGTKTSPAPDAATPGILAAEAQEQGSSDSASKVSQTTVNANLNWLETYSPLASVVRSMEQRSDQYSWLVSKRARQEMWKSKGCEAFQSKATENAINKYNKNIRDQKEIEEYDEETTDEARGYDTRAEITTDDVRGSSNAVVNTLSSANSSCSNLIAISANGTPPTAANLAKIEINSKVINESTLRSFESSVGEKKNTPQLSPDSSPDSVSPTELATKQCYARATKFLAFGDADAVAPSLDVEGRPDQRKAKRVAAREAAKHDPDTSGHIVKERVSSNTQEHVATQDGLVGERGTKSDNSVVTMQKADYQSMKGSGIDRASGVNNDSHAKHNVFTSSVHSKDTVLAGTSGGDEPSRKKKGPTWDPSMKPSNRKKNATLITDAEETTTEKDKSLKKGSTRGISRRSQNVVESSDSFKNLISDTDYFKQNFMLVQKEKDINLFLRKKKKTPVLVTSCVTRYNFGLLEFLLEHQNFFPMQSSFLHFYGVRFVVDYVCEATVLEPGKGINLILGGTTVTQLNTGDEFCIGPVFLPVASPSEDLQLDDRVRESSKRGDRAASGGKLQLSSSVSPQGRGIPTTSDSETGCRSGNTNRRRSSDKRKRKKIQTQYVCHMKVKVQTIRVKRQSFSTLTAGQSCTIQLQQVSDDPVLNNPNTLGGSVRIGTATGISHVVTLNATNQEELCKPSSTGGTRPKMHIGEAGLTSGNTSLAATPTTTKAEDDGCGTPPNDADMRLDIKDAQSDTLIDLETNGEVKTLTVSSNSKLPETDKYNNMLSTTGGETSDDIKGLPGTSGDEQSPLHRDLLASENTSIVGEAIAEQDANGTSVVTGASASGIGTAETSVADCDDRKVGTVPQSGGKVNFSMSKIDEYPLSDDGEVHSDFAHRRRKKKNDVDTETGGTTSGGVSDRGGVSSGSPKNAKNKQKQKKKLSGSSSRTIMQQARRQIRSGLWIYDVDSPVPHFFKRYCLMRLKSLDVTSLDDSFEESKSPRNTNAVVAGSGVACTPIAGTTKGGSGLVVDTTNDPSSSSNAIPSENLPAASPTQYGPVAPFIQKDDHLLLYLHSSRQAVRIAWTTMLSADECVCGVVFLRRPEICLPGLQGVMIKDGVKMAAAGELISTRAMKQITSNPDRPPMGANQQPVKRLSQTKTNSTDKTDKTLLSVTERTGTERTMSSAITASVTASERTTTDTKPSSPVGGVGSFPKTAIR